MKFARYLALGQVKYGVVEGDLLWEIAGSPFGDYQITHHCHHISHVKLLAPCLPSKILAVGLNYKTHLHGREAPKEPMIFYKTPASVIGQNEPIVIPRGYDGRLDEEGELVVVIKRQCKNVPTEEALDYVLGYSCGNDVSARKWQRGDSQWWRAKSSDTFSPVGPYIVTDVDAGNTMLRARVNGKVVQEESTTQLLFDIPTVISFCSRFVTLEPGDMIYTGTPGEPAELKPGDVVEVDIEGVGVLRNPVKLEE